MADILRLFPILFIFNALIINNFELVSSQTNSNIEQLEDIFNQIADLDCISNSEEDGLDAKKSGNIQSFLSPRFVSDVESKIMPFVKVVPSVKLSSISSTRFVGDSLTIACTGSSSSLTWRDYNNMTLTSNSTNYIFVQDGSGEKSLNLVFRNVKMEYQGTYTCTNEIGNSSASSKFTLTVKNLRPTVFLNETANVTLQKGQNYSVTCFGNTGNVTWINGQNEQISKHAKGINYRSVVDDGNQSTLLFHNVSSDIAGTYSCVVTFLGQEASRTINVIVTEPEITFSPENNGIVLVDANKDFEVSCKGPLTNITWLKNREPILENYINIYTTNTSFNTNGILAKTLKFDDVQVHSSYEGTYVCSGVLSNGSLIERSFHLQVTESKSITPPRLSANSPIENNVLTVSANEIVEVECSGDTENIRWFRNSSPVSEDEDNTLRSRSVRLKKKKIILVIHDVVRLDEDQYACVDTKDGINASTTFQLAVIEPAHFVNVPLLPFRANEGETAEIQCQHTGFPAPTLNFYYLNKKKVPLISDPRMEVRNDTLIIRNVTYKDAGRYVCELSQNVNRGLTVDTVVTLLIFHKPVFEKNNITVQKVFGRATNLTCDASSMPSSDYTWIRNNKTIEADDVSLNYIEIPFTDMNETGEYQCSAENKFGSASQIINLEVMVKPHKPTVKTELLDAGVALRIQEPDDSVAESFIIQYRKSNESFWYQEEVKLENEDTYILQELDNATMYILRAQAHNEVDTSDYSDEISFFTGMTPDSKGSGSFFTITVLLITICIAIVIIIFALVVIYFIKYRFVPAPLQTN